MAERGVDNIAGTSNKHVGARFEPPDKFSTILFAICDLAVLMVISIYLSTMVTLLKALAVMVTLLGVDKLGTLALTDLRIHVPEVVRRGESVTLSCSYDLELHDLYTIQWYRYDVEFYRYVPKEAIPSQVFAVPHITVDASRSNAKEVTLLNVERETSGEFRCEVTADAPFFHTQGCSSMLTVADIPEDSPVIKIDVQKIAPRAEFKANCTTPGSYPAMNVTWLINNEQIHDTFGVYVHNSIIHFEALPDLETVHSIISIRASPTLFKGGKLNLRCSATMFSQYSMYDEVEIEEDAPQLAHVRIENSYHSTGATVVCHAFSPAALLILLLCLHPTLRYETLTNVLNVR